MCPKKTQQGSPAGYTNANAQLKESNPPPPISIKMPPAGVIQTCSRELIGVRLRKGRRERGRESGRNKRKESGGDRERMREGRPDREKSCEKGRESEVGVFAAEWRVALLVSGRFQALFFKMSYSFGFPGSLLYTVIIHDG